MKKAVIFGAGEWGRVAYHYYKEDVEIVFYIDNDSTIWNTKINGVLVTSPEVLRTLDCTVIIANKRFESEIKDQLLRDYNIHEVVSFRIDEKMQEIYRISDCQTITDELIVAFSHGLGNQMFQYALYKNFVLQGKRVKADLSAYIKPSMMRFELLSIFPNIKLERCNPQDKDSFVKNRITYIEEPPRNKDRTTYNKDLLKMKAGYIEGFHCSYKYAEDIRTELLSDFMFPYQTDRKLCELKNIIQQKEMVGVHVRRGDFLKPKNQREMGNICTEEYYLKAITYFKREYPDTTFCFFSDDMNWVKNILKVENGMYIEKADFTTYYNWYDMYLMSICKHNIIPNSTFGWWGAWLNQNPDKVVIAPCQWRRQWEATDWCPPEWILI